jgi:predicted RNase H-like nuclease (RuvC/YqgF family)
LELLSAKEECKIKKLTLQRTRREARDERLEARRRELWQRRQGKPEPESEELDRLEEEHSQALREVIEAKVEVEFLKTKLDTFKLLIQLESIG